MDPQILERQNLGESSSGGEALSSSAPQAFLCRLMPVVLSHDHFVGVYVMLSVSAASLWGALPPIGTWSRQFLCRLGFATGYAFYAVLCQLGGFVGPYIVGSLSHYDGNYDSSFHFFGGISLLAAVLVLVFPEPDRMLSDEELKRLGSSCGLITALSLPPKVAVSCERAEANQIVAAAPAGKDHTAINIPQQEAPYATSRHMQALNLPGECA